MPPKQRKIALMGSRSVGKSSLAIQFAQVIMIVEDSKHDGINFFRANLLTHMIPR